MPIFEISLSLKWAKTQIEGIERANLKKQNLREDLSNDWDSMGFHSEIPNASYHMIVQTKSISMRRRRKNVVLSNISLILYEG